MKRQALYSYKLTFSFRTDAGILNYLRGRTFNRIRPLFFIGIFSADLFRLYADPIYTFHRLLKAVSCST